MRARHPDPVKSSHPLATMSSMTFSETYILASKVRNKLTREASNPRSSLRALVVQANMLDNLMDHIQSETEKRMRQPATSTGAGAHVSFSEPQPHRLSTSITEYEVDEDSDDSDDDDYDDSEIVIGDSTDSDFDSDSDSDSDYYYSDSEDEEVDVALAQPIRSIDASATNKSYKQLPYINLSLTKELSIIEEEDEEEEEDHELMPELTKSTSVSDSEEEYDVSDAYQTQPEYITSSTPSKNIAMDKLFVSMRSRDEASNKLHNGSLFDNLNSNGGFGHQRHNAIYDMEHVF